MFNKDILFKRLEQIQTELTKHGSGLKKVFLANEDTSINLTQFAYGEFAQGETCEIHCHPTMDEYFYFLEGSGVYIVDGEEIIITKDSFLRIPAGNYHELQCNKKKLKFVYFGIATDDSY